jgi:hypothetical protein
VLANGASPLDFRDVALVNVHASQPAQHIATGYSQEPRVTPQEQGGSYADAGLPGCDQVQLDTLLEDGGLYVGQAVPTANADATPVVARYTVVPGPTFDWAAATAQIADIMGSTTPAPPIAADVLASPPTLVAAQSAALWDLRLDGNHVVGLGDKGVFVVDLATRKQQWIGSQPRPKTDPQISGDYVTWIEDDSAQLTSPTPTPAMPKPSLTKLADATSLPQSASPADLPPMEMIVHVYDLGTQTEAEIRPEGPDNLQHIGISGHVLVWSAAHGSGAETASDIDSYDLLTNQQSPIVVGGRMALLPQVSGDWVVYYEWPQPGGDLAQGQPELMAHNLATNEDLTLGPAWYSEGNYYCSISGGRVVWESTDGEKLYDFGNRQVRPLSGHSRGDLLAGGSVTAERHVLRNLDTGAGLTLPQPVPSPGATMEGVLTDGQSVVWSSSLNGQYQLYAAQLQRLP